MASIMSLVEGSKPATEISNIEQIDEEVLKEFLNKTPLWDFYETSKGYYMNKSNDEEKLLILSYYNYMNAGINLLFVVWLSFINNKIFSSEFIVWSIVFTVNHYWCCWLYYLKGIFFFELVYGKFVVWVFWFVFVAWIVWFIIWVWNVLRFIFWTICPVIENIIITFFVSSTVLKILFAVASCGNRFLF